MSKKYDKSLEKEYLSTSIKIIQECKRDGRCLDSDVLTKELCQMGYPLYEAELEAHIIPHLTAIGLIAEKGKYSAAEKGIRFHTSCGVGREPVPKQHYIFNTHSEKTLEQCLEELGLNDIIMVKKEDKEND